MSARLTPDEFGALAWAVLHLMDKHGYSSILTPEGERVELEPLLETLVREAGGSG